jgi:hypothetical protein
MSGQIAPAIYPRRIEVRLIPDLQCVVLLVGEAEAGSGAYHTTDAAYIAMTPLLREEWATRTAGEC